MTALTLSPRRNSSLRSFSRSGKMTSVLLTSRMIAPFSKRRTIPVTISPMRGAN